MPQIRQVTPGQPGGLHEIPSHLPKRMLSDYSSASLPEVEQLLKLYIPGASIVTEGVLRQCSDAELILVLGVLDQLVLSINEYSADWVSR